MNDECKANAYFLTSECLSVRSGLMYVCTTWRTSPLEPLSFNSAMQKVINALNAILTASSTTRHSRPSLQGLYSGTRGIFHSVLFDPVPDRRQRDCETLCRLQARTHASRIDKLDRSCPSSDLDLHAPCWRWHWATRYIFVSIIIL